MTKSPEAFRTISEVAEWLDVPTHVLRFWESRFTQVKPVKRAGGRRYYRPSDMELLGGIKRLLHDDGLTIRGVQKLLREEGIRHVAALSPPRDADGDPEGGNVVSLRFAEQIDAPRPDPEPTAPPEADPDTVPEAPSEEPEDTPLTAAEIVDPHAAPVDPHDAPAEPPRRAPLGDVPLLDETAIYIAAPGIVARLLGTAQTAIARDRATFDAALDRARALRDAMDRLDG